MGAGLARGDNGRMQERGLGPARGGLPRGAEPPRQAEPGRIPGWSDEAVDMAIAVVATIAAVLDGRGAGSGAAPGGIFMALPCPQAAES